MFGVGRSKKMWEGKEGEFSRLVVDGKELKIMVYKGGPPPFFLVVGPLRGGRAKTPKTTKKKKKKI